MARIEGRIPPGRRQTLYTEIIAEDIKLDKLEGQVFGVGDNAAAELEQRYRLDATFDALADFKTNRVPAVEL